MMKKLFYVVFAMMPIFSFGASTMATKYYVDNATNNVFVSAKQYVDSEIATNKFTAASKEYVNSATNTVLSLSKSYTDATSNNAYLMAKEYTDSVCTVRVDTAYVDSATNGAVSISKAYSDDVLVQAKAYARQLISTNAVGTITGSNIVYTASDGTVKTIQLVGVTTHNVYTWDALIVSSSSIPNLSYGTYLVYDESAGGFRNCNISDPAILYQHSYSGGFNNLCYTNSTGNIYTGVNSDGALSCYDLYKWSTNGKDIIANAQLVESYVTDDVARRLGVTNKVNSQTSFFESTLRNVASFIVPCAVAATSQGNYTTVSCVLGLGSGGEIVIEIPISRPTGFPPKVTWKSEDPDYEYSPDEWPTEEDWNNIHNWYSGVITFENVGFKTDEDALNYKKYADEGNFEEAKKYANIDTILLDVDEFAYLLLDSFNYSIYNLIPAYSEPELVKIKDKCDVKHHGHDWSSCVCLKCGLTRTHNLSYKVDGNCDTCINRDGMEYDAHGKEITDGDYCGSHYVTGGSETISSEDHHHGWHDSDGLKGNLATCTCQCGALNKNHDIDTNIPDNSWNAGRFNYDSGKVDKSESAMLSWHFAYVQCARYSSDKKSTRCDGTYYVNEGHSYDNTKKPAVYKAIKWNEETGGYVECEPSDKDADRSRHWVKNTCWKCLYESEAFADHTPDANCICTYCKVPCHSWIKLLCSGQSYYDIINGLVGESFENLTCSNCHTFPEQSAITPEWCEANGVPESMWPSTSDPYLYPQSHYYGVNIHSSSGHKCFCGIATHKHEGLESGAVSSKNRCRWCGYPDGDEDADGANTAENKKTYVSNGTSGSGSSSAISFSSFTVGDSSVTYPDAPGISTSTSVTDIAPIKITEDHHICGNPSFVPTLSIGSEWKLQGIDVTEARHVAIETSFPYISAWEWPVLTYHFKRISKNDYVDIVIDTYYLEDDLLIEIWTNSPAENQ